VSKGKLYSTLVLNLLLYGCENWVLTAPLRQLLNTCQDRCVRAMACPQCTSFSSTNDHPAPFVKRPALAPMYTALGLTSLDLPPSVCSVTEGGGVTQRGPIQSLGSEQRRRRCNPRLFGDGFVLVTLAMEKEWYRDCMHQTKSSGIALRCTCLALPATRWPWTTRVSPPSAPYGVHRLISWEHCVVPPGIGCGPSAACLWGRTSAAPPERTSAARTGKLECASPAAPASGCAPCLAAAVAAARQCCLRSCADGGASVGCAGGACVSASSARESW
jgi:hypothetical protein